MRWTGGLSGPAAGIDEDFIRPFVMQAEWAAHSGYPPPTAA